MCGKCEHVAGKAGLGLGILGTVLAVVSKCCYFSVLHAGPRGFAAFAALMFLMAIAANTSHPHETP